MKKLNCFSLLMSRNVELTSSSFSLVPTLYRCVVTICEMNTFYPFLLPCLCSHHCSSLSIEWPMSSTCPYSIWWGWSLSPWLSLIDLCHATCLRLWMVLLDFFLGLVLMCWCSSSLFLLHISQWWANVRDPLPITTYHLCGHLSKAHVSSRSVPVVHRTFPNSNVLVSFK